MESDIERGKLLWNSVVRGVLTDNTLTTLKFTISPFRHKLPLHSRLVPKSYFLPFNLLSRYLYCLDNFHSATLKAGFAVRYSHFTFLCKITPN